MKEGNTARFELELTHENVPVVWYRNEVKLHVSRTVLTYVDGMKHSLEMRMLSLDDTCQIKAEAKGIYSMAKLTVIGNSHLISLSQKLLNFLECSSCPLPTETVRTELVKRVHTVVTCQRASAKSLNVFGCRGRCCVHRQAPGLHSNGEGRGDSGL